MVDDEPIQHEYEVAQIIAYDRWPDQTVQDDPELIETCRPLARQIILYLEENKLEW